MDYFSTVAKKVLKIGGVFYREIDTEFFNNIYNPAAYQVLKYSGYF
jgi:hypothetical protein